ncbi:MAG: hypothetical protein OXP36_13735 [Gammaproteobacteria bacterium]|nr:hypothetical protein [Gammaproteobacteria bacterium]
MRPALGSPVLEIFYEANGGPNWTRNDYWLSDAPLGEWHGAETDASGRVVRLEMAKYDPAHDDVIGNNLVGTIPVELGQLASLERLVLVTGGPWT